jgi:hypothetical protein
VQGYTRHKLKEDKFAEKTKDAVEWTAGHQRMVAWIIGAVVIAALAVFGGMTWYNRQNDAANAALGTAMRTLSAQLRPAGIAATPDNKDTFGSVAERAQAAEKEFKSAADQYDKFPYPKAGRIARYMQGVSAMNAGDSAGAEQVLKGAAGSRDASVAALAKMSLAALYRSSGRQADAVKIYKDLQDHPTDTVSKAQAQLEMAEMYETSDPQQAFNIYQQIQKDNPQSPAGQIATTRLAGSK